MCVCIHLTPHTQTMHSHTHPFFLSETESESVPLSVKSPEQNYRSVWWKLP